jgi:hypothetical protein
MIYFRELLAKVMAVVGEDADPKAYLDYIRSMPCLVQGRDCYGKVEPHHLQSRGAGGSDFLAIPLCSGHHTGGIHVMGIDTFARHYGIDYEKVILHLARLYNQLDTNRIGNGKIF